MILAGALAVDRVADLRLRAASSIHPGSVAPGARWRPACPCSSTPLQLFLRHRVVRHRAGSQAAPSRTVPRRCPCARRKAPLINRAQLLRRPAAPATPTPQEAANDPAADIATQRKHVKILRLPGRRPLARAWLLPTHSRFAALYMVPLNFVGETNDSPTSNGSLPVAAAPSATTQTRQGPETTTKNNKPRVVPGNRLNCSSRRQPIQRSRS